MNINRVIKGQKTQDNVRCIINMIDHTPQKLLKLIPKKPSIVLETLVSGAEQGFYL